MDLNPLDPVYVADVLSRPPFVSISGVHNVRDLGSYPSSRHNEITKPKFVFRSAEISGITEEGVSLNLLCLNLCSENASHLDFSLGKAQMKALGITKVFDLRSDTEIEKYSAPQPVIDGVEILRAPVFQTEDYSPEMMAKCVRVSYPPPLLSYRLIHR